MDPEMGEKVLPESGIEIEDLTLEPLENLSSLSLWRHRRHARIRLRKSVAEREHEPESRIAA